MEQVVNEEIARQLMKVPDTLRTQLKPLEIATYALNRLPTLYASSQKGWHKQYETAAACYANDVTKAVCKGISAVKANPQRASEPLDVKKQHDAAAILSAFKQLLNQPELSWDDILYKCKRVLLPPNHPDRPPLKDETQHKAFWRPRDGDSYSMRRKALQARNNLS